MKPIIQQEGQTDKPIVDDDSKCILDPELVPLRNCFLIFNFDRVIKKKLKTTKVVLSDNRVKTGRFEPHI